MAGVNRVTLIGNLGADPEIRYTPGGLACGRFSLATTEYRKGEDEQKIEETEWHKVVVFGRTAEICGEFLTKGKQVYIEGKLKTRDYRVGGEKKYITEVVVSVMQMLGGRPKEAEKPPIGGTQEHKASSSSTGEDVPF